MSTSHSTLTLTAEQVATFHGLIGPTDANGCRLWQGGFIEGYGAVRFDGRQFATHRLAWMLHNGKDIPHKDHVCHLCDVRACCSPDHLFLGTARDNQQDCSAKGRKPHGSKHHNAKLSEADIPVIRAAYDAGENWKTIAARHDVSITTVDHIGKRMIWLRVLEADGTSPVPRTPRRACGNKPRPPRPDLVPSIPLAGNPGLLLTPRQVANFWSKINKDAPGGCWLWTGSLRDGWHGQIGFGGKNFSTHSVAWLLLGGDILLSGSNLCHSCDVGHCCNPAHMRIGTHADNARDKTERNRNPNGIRNGNAVLTEDQVREIRSLRASGMKLHAIATHFKVSRSAVKFILYGKTWTHVT